MDSKPIKHTDLIEENVFDNAIKSTVEFEGELQKLIAGLKQVAGVTGKQIKNNPVDPKSIDDVKKLNDQIAKLKATEQGYTEAKRQLYTLQEKQRQSDRLIKDEIKQRIVLENSEVGSLKSLRAELALVTAQWNKVSEAHRENTSTGKLLTQQKTELTLKLKELEGATEDHRRNVGNYGNALKGLTAIGIALGETFGIDAEKIRSLTEAHGILRHGIMGTHEVMENLVGEEKAAAVASTELAEGQEAAAVATLGTASAMKLLKYALVATGIGALVAILGLLYSAWNENKRKEEEIAEINKELIKLAEELKKAYEELDKAVYDASIRELENIKKVLEARMAANGKTIAGLKGIKEEDDKIISAKKKHNQEEIDQNDFMLARQEAMLANAEKLAAKYKIGFKKGSYTDGEGKEHTTTEQTGDEVAYKITEKEIAQLKLKIAQNKTANTKLLSDQNELNTDLIVNDIKLNKEIVDLNKDKYAKELDDLKKYLELVKKLTLEERFDLQEVRDQEERDKDEKIKTDMEKWRDIKNAENDYLIEQLEIRKKKEDDARKERIQSAISEQEQILFGIKDGLANRNQLEEQAIKNRASMADSEIKIQSDLAARGKKNMLDFELKEKAKALDQELQLKKKAQREQEGLQLANLFLEFEKVYAKDGPGAAAKALQQTLLGKGIAAGLTAVFAEEGGLIGDNDKKTSLGLDGWSKRHKSGNDVLVLAEKNERILSVADNLRFEMLGGMDFLNNPQRFMMPTIVNDYSRLEKKLDSLENTIKNKKEFNITEDVLKRIVYTEKENGHSVSKVQIPPSKQINKTR